MTDSSVREPGTMQPLRVGLIGAGFIGSMRARALEQMPGEFRLVAIADERQFAAKKLAGGKVRVYTEPAVLAADPEIDAVILSTPPVSHQSLGLACLEQRKHLLVEKPLAADVSACERLVQMARQQKVCLATGFTLRYTPATQLARRIVDEGAIGEIDHVRVFHGHRGGIDFGPTWITEHEMTGGGTLMDNGIHMIDMARWFLGDVVHVEGLASNHSWRKPGCEDNGFILMRSAQGQIGVVHSSWTEWQGYRWRCEVYGTRGVVRFGFPPLWLVHTWGIPGERMKRRYHPFVRYQIMERLRGWEWSLIATLVADLRSWRGAIRTGGEALLVSGKDGLEAVRIAKSAALNQ